MSSPWAARRPLSCRAATIFKAFGPEADFGGSDWQPMIDGLWKKTFGDAERSDPETVEAAYRRYLDRVRETIPASRLVEFETGAGWQPLCDALGLPIPDEPFPHLNSTAEFNSRTAEELTAASAEAEQSSAERQPRSRSAASRLASIANRA